MNDDARLERLLAEGLHDLAPARGPDRLRTKVKAETSDVRPHARWLARIKEPPMRTNNHVAVGSPIARAAAILVATLLLAVSLAAAGVAGSRLLAAADAIVVAADGGGDYTTISDAVAVADDGDEIAVRPGTYNETIFIDKDITLRGDGPVDEVVIEVFDAILAEVRDSDVVIAGLTLRGDETTQGMEIYGGAPTIRDVVFDHTGRPFNGNTCTGGREECGGTSLAILGGSAQVLDSVFRGGGEISVHGNANVVLEGNEMIDGPHLYLADPGDATIIRENTIRATLDRAIGQFGPGTPLIESNIIEGAGGDGITVGHGASGNIPDGHDPMIADNEISGSNVGVFIAAGAGPTIAGNRISGNATGIGSYSGGSVLRQNWLEGNSVGVNLSRAEILEANQIIRGEVGMIINLTGSRTLPPMVDNTICDNVENLRVGGFEVTELDDSNEICEDASVE